MDSANPDKLKILIDRNDLNERALIYSQFCLPQDEPLSQSFSDYYQDTGMQLLDEFVDLKKGEPKFAMRHILERRKRLQQLLGGHYFKEGCSTNEALLAQQHYNQFKGNE